MIWAIIKKELLQLRRDPRLIALILVMPLLLLILFGLALKLEPENMKMAYFDEDRSFFTMLIDTELGNEGYFDLYKVDSLELLQEEIRSGRAKAGLHINSDFSALLVENKQPHITFYVDGTMPSLTTAMKYNSKSITNDTNPRHNPHQNLSHSQQCPHRHQRGILPGRAFSGTRAGTLYIHVWTCAGPLHHSPNCILFYDRPAACLTHYLHVSSRWFLAPSWQHVVSLHFWR